MRHRGLVHVVLVLADADRLRFDLHQLRQRVLQPPRDRHCAAQAHVELGQFLARKFARRVDRRTGLADHHLLDVRARSELLNLLDEIGGQLVGLAAGGAVADGDQVHAVRRTQPAQRVDGAIPVALGLVRIDGRCVQHLAGVTHHRHLHAGANAGVQAHHHALARGCGEQQVAQVLGEHLDGDLLGVLAQASEEVALEAQRELDLPGPRDGLANEIVARTLGVAPAEVTRDAPFGKSRLTAHHFFIEHQLCIEDLQRAAAEHRERAV